MDAGGRELGGKKGTRWKQETRARLIQRRYVTSEQREAWLGLYAAALIKRQMRMTLTLRECAAFLLLSQEMARQHELRALDKIRACIEMEGGIEEVVSAAEEE